MMLGPVLYLVPDFWGLPSGIARYCRLVAKAMSGLADTVTIVAFADDESAKPPELDQFEYYPCSYKRSRFIEEVLRQTARLRPQVILNGHAHFSPLSYAMARATGAKLVSFMYGLEVWEPLSFWRRWGLRHSDLLIAISHFTARQGQAQNQIPLRKTRILHNCFDQVGALPTSRRYSNSLPCHLLTVARMNMLEQYKGHDYVLRALALLKSQNLDLTYDVVGDGDGRPQLMALAEELGVANLVRWHGRVNDEVLRQHYTTADIFVMPSRAEGFGFVFLEAMAHGLPVVAGNVDATPEVVVDNRTGFLVDPTSASEIAAAIARLLDNPLLQRQMGEAGRLRVQHDFQFELFRSKLFQYLGELVPKQSL